MKGCVDGCWEAVCNDSQEGIAGAACSQMELFTMNCPTQTQNIAIEGRSINTVTGMKHEKCKSSSQLHCTRSGWPD